MIHYTYEQYLEMIANTCKLSGSPVPRDMVCMLSALFRKEPNQVCSDLVSRGALLQPMFFFN